MKSLPESFFLTGTDTGVGKTYVAAKLVQERRISGLDCIGMKPICCGERDDAELLYTAAGATAKLNEINPLWLRAAAAPYVAGMIESRPIDLSAVREAFALLRARHKQVIVEGVGGWRVPITRDFAVSDLAAEMALPIVVVAANRLGALNHTLLTVEAIQRGGLECAGVILNEVSPRSEKEDAAVLTNAATLSELLTVPILREFPYEPRRSIL